MMSNFGHAPLGKEDVNLLAREALYEGYFALERLRLTHRLYGEGWTGELTREVLTKGDVVSVLPYDPARDSVLLVEQFRQGPYRRGGEPWIVECIAGGIDAGETPEVAARRETLEEGGCALDELILMHRTYSSPGITTEYRYTYCGQAALDGVGGAYGTGAKGGEEDIRTIEIPASEVQEAVAQDLVRDSSTLAALQWFLLNREKVRTRWRAPAP